MTHLDLTHSNVFVMDLHDYLEPDIIVIIKLLHKISITMITHYSKIGKVQKLRLLPMFLSLNHSLLTMVSLTLSHL